MVQFTIIFKVQMIWKDCDEYQNGYHRKQYALQHESSSITCYKMFAVATNKRTAKVFHCDLLEVHCQSSSHNRYRRVSYSIYFRKRRHRIVVWYFLFLFVDAFEFYFCRTLSCIYSCLPEALPAPDEPPHKQAKKSNWNVLLLWLGSSCKAKPRTC